MVECAQELGLGQRHPQGKRPMRGQVAGEAVGNRFARFLVLVGIALVILIYAIMIPLLLAQGNF